MNQKLGAFILVVTICLYSGCTDDQKGQRPELVMQPWEVLADATEEICISDGSSLYIFHPNGEFELEPLAGESGRTVKGEWKLRSTMVQVTGKWSWINGVSFPNDSRTMIINVGNIEPKSVEITSNNSGKVHKVRKAYFVIESLEKQKS